MEGRKERSVKALFFEVNEEEKQPQIERVNNDIWKPYINVMKELSPNALQVHDKFHLVKKLSEAIDKTIRSEFRDNPILVCQKYTVLKLEENRTEAQQKNFEIINKANLKTAQAWLVRQNFRTIFEPNHWTEKLYLYKNWLQDALSKDLKHINAVAETFKRQKKA